MKPTLLILAAGMGSRYGGLKQMDPIGPNGETIIDYSIFDAIEAGFGKIVFVIRESFEQEFKKLFLKKLQGSIDLEFVTQEIYEVPQGCAYDENREKPWGTGHAILMAKDYINEPFAVINADDFYGKEAFRTISDFLQHQCTDQEYGMVGYQIKNTISENGSVSRGVCAINEQNQLVDVNECTHIERIDGRIASKENDNWVFMEDNTLVSMNFWGFAPSLFEHLESQFIEFIRHHGNETKSEFFIPTVVSSLIKTNESSVKVLNSDAEWFGVTYKVDKEKAILSINQLMDEGYYPKKLWK